jgi:hypothetical protein
MILTIYGEANMSKGEMKGKEKPMNGGKAMPKPCDKSKDACGGAKKKGK